MNITSFNPLVLSPNAESAIGIFESLGFEKKHEITAIAEKGIVDVRMTDANGFAVDVAQVGSLEKDMTIIRMNVDDFDEARAMLEAQGCKSSRSDGSTVDTETNRSILMISPSGFAFDLCQHIKD